MPSLRTGALVLAAFAAAASTAAPLAQSQVPSLEGYPVVGTPAVVTLVSAGAEPRSALRYRIAAGQKSTMVMSMAMQMAMTVGEFAAPAADLPIMKVTADLAVTGVAANGDISYDLAFTGMTAEPAPGIDPGLVAAVQQSSAGITAVKGTVTVSDRGVNRAARFDLDKVTDGTLRQMLASLSTSIESMSTPLPEEAVGTGARWEVRQAFQSGGTHLFQRGEYELVSIDSGLITLRVRFEQTAPRQAVSNPALPAGATFEIEKMTGAGSGAITLRLDGLVPTGELSSASTALVNATVNGQTQRMTVDTRLKVTVGVAR